MRSSDSTLPAAADPGRVTGRSTPSALVRAACFGLLAAALAASAGDASAQQMPPSPVRCDPVRTEKTQERRRVSGNVRPRERTRVAAREPGRAVESEVREGQRVEKGAVLARLDDARLRLDLEVVTAERRAAELIVSERKQDLEQRRRDLETLRGLAARNATNPREVSDAETAATMAESRVGNSESQLGVFDARLAVLEMRIGDMTVRAPFAGVVVSRLASAGSWVQEGDPVAEMISDEVEAWLDVPQRDYAFLSAGAAGKARTVRIESESGIRPLDAPIARLLADVDPKSRTFALVAKLAADKGLVAGMSVTAWVPTGAESEQLTVANDALLRGEAGPFIYVAMPPQGAAAPAAGGTDGAGAAAGAAPHTAQPVQVEIVFVADGRTAIRAPQLRAGALAIVEGNERLFPSAPVAPIASTAPGTPAAAPGGGR